MTTEEKESQEPWVGEKVYPNPGVKPTTYVLYLVAGIVGVVLGVLLRTYAVEIVEALFDVALKFTVSGFRDLGLGMVIVFSVYIVALIIVIFAGYSIKEIVLSKEGVVFKRRRNPIIVQKITSMEEIRSGRIVKLTGLTPEGKTVNKRV